jgi:hypothetical protein
MVRPILRLALACAVAAGPVAGQGQPARIHGLVIEYGRGTPVSEVTVSLLPVGLRAISDAGGRFVLRDIPPGRWEMRLERIGYVTRVDTAYIGEGAPVNITVALATQPVPLGPIEVEVRSRELELAGVYDRRDRIRTAHFFNAAQIENLRVPLMTDLFHRMPSMKVIDYGPGRRVVRFNRASFAGAACEPAFFIDGQLIRDNLSDAGGAVLDFNRVPPEQIAVLEVYVGALTPLEFRQNDCGAVLVWTKRGG